MRRILSTTALGLAFVAPAAVNGQSDERGRLEALIEDNLSAEGMQIDITGFQGALSSEAQLEELTIADEEGVWLTLRGAVLDWNRLALLRGRLSVNELTADEIILARLPSQPADATVEVPDAATQPFSLPELPVSVQVGRIAAERVEIGAPVIGQPVEFRLEGSASLAGGEGEVALDVERTDDRQGEITLDAAYANDSRELSVDLDVNEGPGGIVASLAGIPGEPALELTVEGSGPLSDFAADLAFATDGEDRLAGRIAVADIADADRAGTQFDVDVEGDVRPLLTPENREFFGPSLSLDVSGQSYAEGGLVLETLSLDSDAITLDGTVELNAQNWPVLVSLTGRMQAEDGGPVALPLPGQDTRVDRAAIDIDFNAAEGDTWQAGIAVEGLDRPDLDAASFRLDGDGTLTQGEGSGLGAAAGQFDLSAEGLEFADPDLAQAVGDTLSGLVSFDWTQGSALELTGIDLTGAGITTTGTVSVSGIANDLNIVIAPDLSVVADDISRFSGLAGRDLSGAVDVQAEGTFEPVSGAFDMAVDGSATDIETGIPEVDGLVAGQLDLAIDAARNEAGIVLRTLNLASETLTATAEGRVGGNETDARFDIDIADMTRVRPDLEGRLAVAGTVVQDGEDYTLDLTGAGPGGARIDADVTATLVDNLLTAVGGTGTVAVDTLDTFSGIAGRELGGAVRVEGTGRYDLQSSAATADVSGTGTDIATGIAELDALLAGQSRFVLDGGRNEEGITLRTLELTTPRADITAEGRLRDDGSTAEFDVALSELAAVVPTMSGDARLSGTASQDGEAWSFDVTGSGPGGARADLDGTARLVGTDFRGVDATGSIAADDLSAYAGLVDRPLGGALTFDGSGSFERATGFFSADVSGTSTDVATGIAELDALLEGEATYDVEARRDADGITVDELRIAAPRVSVTGDGVYAETGSRANFDAVVTDLASVVQGMTGEARLSGTADQTGDTVDFDITGSGPGGAAADIAGAATLDGLALRAIEAAGALGIETLRPYAELVGRPLSGSARFEGSGSYELATQFFSADVSGRSQDVTTGIPQADALLAGTATYDIDAARDDDGIVLRNLRIEAPRARATAEGTYRDTGSNVRLEARMTDLGDVLDGLSGGAQVDATAQQDGDVWNVDATASGPGGAEAQVDAALRVVENALEAVEGSGTVSVTTLAPYGSVAGRRLGGSVSVEGSGSYALESQEFSADVDGRVADLRTGISAIDQLLRGTTTFGATAAGDPGGAIRIDRLVVDGTEIDATVNGTYGGNSGDVRYDLRLRDVGLFVPDLSGPLTAEGTAQLAGGGYRIDAGLTGPGGTNANVSGTAAQDFGRVNLSVTGAAPLGLANGFIEPNILQGQARFDLRVNGAPGLDAVSGTVTTTGSEFALPSQGLTVNGIDAQVGLSGGRADIDLTGGLSSGGQLSVSGPVTLSPPFNGDLAITLDGLQYVDAGFIESTANGSLRLTGPLASTATLSGNIALGRTEVRVPSGGTGNTSLSFDVRHVNPPADVQETRARAGFRDPSDDGGAGGGGGGVNYGLDVTVTAPSQIFVRGRGLDAELGGEVVIGGTLQNIQPVGRFDLIRGRLDILGQRLTLSEAYIQLEGDLNPFIYVRADTQRDENTIAIIIEGPVSEPEVDFTSSPDRPEEEVLALLLFGRDLSEISGLQALRIASAINTLAGRSGTSLVDRLRMSTGLDDLDVQTGADGQTELRLGRYINERAYTDVTVNSEGETEINLNLTITPSVTARGTVGSGGNTGVGIYYERDY
ncbi:translocation/assembly module TamB domain-containing protein [Roseivivax isoporae]|uniref:Translocation and assembly module TamB C-terminal domain-containing protein n=1 Tax=Roseivivax isoporae LMG 25204 TaxID=1449351 RepID=X7FD72_9RHOB|nr:translocation/assembly module TamB domain-containing protein [Roseivivax isoporae]ETX30867.1 hypothetical protein RISW2_00375 [Roseivivax isoporae LMG 25204]